MALLDLAWSEICTVAWIACKLKNLELATENSSKKWEGLILPCTCGGHILLMLAAGHLWQWQYWIQSGDHYMHSGVNSI